MTKRTGTFVAEYLKPLIMEKDPTLDVVVAIVSHGILLSHLWRSILALFSKKTVALAPGLHLGGGATTPLEHLGGWSNTGYLELDIATSSPHVVLKDEENIMQPVVETTEANTSVENSSPLLPPGITMLVRTVNGKEHLKGLKRARGVGSSQYDEGQKKIGSFFKKTKLG